MLFSAQHLFSTQLVNCLESTAIPVLASSIADPVKRTCSWSRILREYPRGHARSPQGRSPSLPPPGRSPLTQVDQRVRVPFPPSRPYEPSIASAMTPTDVSGHNPRVDERWQMEEWGSGLYGDSFVIRDIVGRFVNANAVVGFF